MGKEEYQKWHNSPENPWRQACSKLLQQLRVYNVLWIEWHGGIAYRKALDRVVKPVWDSRILEEIGL